MKQNKFFRTMFAILGVLTLTFGMQSCWGDEEEDEQPTYENYTELKLIQRRVPYQQGSKVGLLVEQNVEMDTEKEYTAEGWEIVNSNPDVVGVRFITNPRNSPHTLFIFTGIKVGTAKVTILNHTTKEKVTVSLEVYDQHKDYTELKFMQYDGSPLRISLKVTAEYWTENTYTAEGWEVVNSNPNAVEVKVHPNPQDNAQVRFTGLQVGEATVTILNHTTKEKITIYVAVFDSYSDYGFADDVTDEQKQVIANLINNMVKVEGGTFMMGAAEDDTEAFDNEKPQHKFITVCIGKYEVTQKEWKTVMGKNPFWFQGEKTSFNSEELPVEQVSWYDCQDFIKELNRMTLNRYNFRLPTEAQWEFAARGGNKSKGYKYAGSSNIDEVAWYEKNGNHETHPVGTKVPNELGLYDMSGNVEEWCNDWYDENYYKESPQNNPQGPSTGKSRVFRGNCYHDRVEIFRISYRHAVYPTDIYFALGLRLVMNY